MLKSVFLAAVVFLSALQGAHADDMLRGFKEIKLLVEELSEKGKGCNVNEDLIDAAVRITLSKSTLTIAKDPSNFRLPTLYVNVNVLSLQSGLCMSNVTLELYRPVWLSANAPQYPSERAVVWNTGSLFYGPSHSFGKQVSDVLEGQTKKFLGAWLKVN